MNTAHALKSKTSTQAQTPLVNLFAYIRDLFNTTTPSFQFDTEASPWWDLQSLQPLAQSAQTPLSLQWNDPTQPLLTLKRIHFSQAPKVPESLASWIKLDTDSQGLPTIEIIPNQVQRFHDSPKRISAFRAFESQVSGKTIEEVSSMTIPALLNPWITLEAVEGKIQIGKIAEAQEPFEADDLRVELLAAFERSLTTYRESHQAGMQLNQLYESLHSIIFELKAQGVKQLFLSFGLVAGKIGKENYRNFLFHVPLALEMEQQEIKVSIDTVSHAITCEQGFTELLADCFPNESQTVIDQRIREVLSLVDTFNSQPRAYNLDSEYVRRTYYQPALEMLSVFPGIQDRFFEGNELNFSYQNELPEHRVLFSFSPVIHLRTTGHQVNISQDASRIIAKIHELGSKGNNESIPDFFKKLFTLRKPGNPLRIAYRHQDKEIQTESRTMEARPERFLFPLPYNAEQMTIAEQLLNQDAVTVKGPPGTGKSHTIANLTSHFVAQGKSILIVSKNAKALEVIKEKLPEEIRNLAVSFLNDGAKTDELKHSIDAIKDHLGRTYSQAEWKALEQQLRDLDQAYADKESEILEMIRLNGSVITLFDPKIGKAHSLSAESWAKRWKETQRPLLLLADDVDAETNSEALAESVVQLIKELKEMDHEVLNYTYPPTDDLLSQLDFERICAQLEIQETKINPATYDSINANSLTPRVLELAAQFQDVWDTMTPHLSIIQHENFQVDRFRTFLNSALPAWKEIQRESQQAEKINLDLSPLGTTHSDILLQRIQKLIEKFGDKSRLNLIKRQLLSKDEKLFFQCMIDGNPIQTKEELRILEKQWNQHIKQEHFEDRLTAFYGSLGISLNSSQSSEYLESGEDLLIRYENYLALQDQLSKHSIPCPSVNCKDPESWLAYLAGLEEFKAWGTANDALQTALSKMRNIASTHPTWKIIVKAAESRNPTEYQQGLQAFETARKGADQARAVLELQATVAEQLPKTVEKIISGAITDEISTADLLQDIFQTQLGTALSDTCGAFEKGATLFEELNQLQTEIRETCTKLIAVKTWYHKQQEISDEQLAALSAWRNDLVNIGKGHGKNTARNTVSAVKNMQLAKNTVPIWIMQQDTAIEFFPEVTPGQFDLLIVDEASQCDISALNLVFRAQKSIIVGDENQTSVATNANLFPIERTNTLLDRYLINHPFKQQFNINNRTASVYTLSGVIYPNIVNLNEHFRCRPEIIGFSNRFVYNQQIIPLRTATDAHFGAPVEAHYIEDDPKDKKKPRIVEQAIAMIAGVIEDFQAGYIPNIPSIGILCLDASNEEHRDLITKELNRNRLIKSYADELNILVGTSREFQGDERDVMILTTTASHGFTPTGKIKAPRAVLGEEMMRIYNVAASRAKDKSILLHSIPPEAVALMKPNCYRRNIIEYYTDQAGIIHENESTSLSIRSGSRTSALSDEDQSLMEILTELEMADQVRRNMRVGNHKINFALVGPNGKRGIEWDGETSSDVETALHQHLTLERAGWKFFRIQRTELLYDRARVVDRLKGWL